MTDQTRAWRPAQVRRGAKRRLYEDALVLAEWDVDTASKPYTGTHHVVTIGFLSDVSHAIAARGAWYAMLWQTCRIFRYLMCPLPAWPPRSAKDRLRSMREITQMFPKGW